MLCLSSLFLSLVLLCLFFFQVVGGLKALEEVSSGKRGFTEYLRHRKWCARTSQEEAFVSFIFGWVICLSIRTSAVCLDYSYSHGYSPGVL